VTPPSHLGQLRTHRKPLTSAVWAVGVMHPPRDLVVVWCGVKPDRGLPLWRRAWQRDPTLLARRGRSARSDTAGTDDCAASPSAHLLHGDSHCKYHRFTTVVTFALQETIVNKLVILTVERHVSPVIWDDAVAW